MEIFQIVRKLFLMLGIDLKQTVQNHSFHSALNFRSLTTVLIFGYGTTVCLRELLFNCDTFMEYIFAFYAVSSMILCLTLYTFVLWSSPEFIKFFIRAQNVIQERMKNSKAFEIYDKTNKLVELCSRIVYVVVVKYLAPVFMLPRFLFSFLVYFTTDEGNDAFEMPFPFWAPFDRKNPIGYTIAVIIQTYFLWHNFCFTSCMVTFAVGFFLIGTAEMTEIKDNLHHFNKIAEKKRNRLESLQGIKNFINFESTIKDSIYSFSDLYQPIIAVLFGWCIVTMSGALLMFQMEINQKNFIMVILAIVQIVWSLSLAFIPCELGGRLTIIYNGIYDVICELDWYAFPLEIQKILPIIMIITEKPVAMQVFASILCNRDVFKRINNTAFSYFMVLREFGE